MPSTRISLALAGVAAIAAVTAPASLAVRAPRPAEARAIRAALTPQVQQALCVQAPVDAAKCAASTLGVQRIRIASDNPKYAWVKLVVTSGPAAEDWFAQDGNVWKRTGAKWAVMKGGNGCSYPVIRKLPKPVEVDFGAEYCGIAPPGVGEG